MRWWLVALVLSGCGRIGFDALATGDGSLDDIQNLCPVVTHDEDGDQRDDSCDVCPHVADPEQLDLDGDGVGNACDPETGNPRQQIVLFDPFTTLDPAWLMFGGASRVENDTMVMEGAGGYRAIRRTLTPTYDVFQIGATTGPATGRHIISLVTPPASGAGSFYCEMYDDAPQPRTMFTYTFDDTMFLHDGMNTWTTTRLANGAGTFQYEITPSSTSCTSVWNGETNTALGTPKSQLMPERFVIYAENVDVRIDYLVQIRTTP